MLSCFTGSVSQQAEADSTEKSVKTSKTPTQYRIRKSVTFNDLTEEKTTGKGFLRLGATKEPASVGDDLFIKVWSFRKNGGIRALLETLLDHEQESGFSWMNDDDLFMGCCYKLVPPVGCLPIDSTTPRQEGPMVWSKRKIYIGMRVLLEGGFLLQLKERSFQEERVYYRIVPKMKLRLLDFLALADEFKL